MKVLYGNKKTFLISHNPTNVAFIENKGGKNVTVFYPSVDNMPASVRASFASRMRHSCK